MRPTLYADALLCETLSVRTLCLRAAMQRTLCLRPAACADALPCGPRSVRTLYSAALLCGPRAVRTLPVRTLCSVADALLCGPLLVRTLCSAALLSHRANGLSTQEELDRLYRDLQSKTSATGVIWSTERRR